MLLNTFKCVQHPWHCCKVTLDKFRIPSESCSEYSEPCDRETFLEWCSSFQQIFLRSLEPKLTATVRDSSRVIQPCCMLPPRQQYQRLSTVACSGFNIQATTVQPLRSVSRLAASCRISSIAWRILIKGFDNSGIPHFQPVLNVSHKYWNLATSLVSDRLRWASLSQANPSFS